MQQRDLIYRIETRGKAEWAIKEKVLSPFRKLLEISDIFENIQ